MKKIIIALIKFLCGVLTHSLLVIPHKKTNFVFTSKYGFSDNSKYLFLYYLKQGINCTWVASDDACYLEVEKKLEKHPNAKVIRRNSIKLLVTLARAKYVFVTHSFQDLGGVAIKTCPIINLWHGIPIKKMGFDSQNDIKLFSLDTFNPYKLNDFVISSSEVTKSFSISCMNITPSKVLPLGQPRNDFLYGNRKNKSLIKELKSNYSELDEGKLFLYAPTFRDEDNISLSIYMDLINSFTKSAQKNDTLVLRLHPKERELLVSIKLPDNIKHSKITDVQEELLAADILISDYSSIIFDFSILKKPIILFTPDRDGYFENRGGSYFEYDKILRECNAVKDHEIDSIWTEAALKEISYTQLTPLHAMFACKSIYEQFN